MMRHAQIVVVVVCITHTELFSQHCTEEREREQENKSACVVYYKGEESSEKQNNSV